MEVNVSTRFPRRKQDVHSAVAFGTEMTAFSKKSRQVVLNSKGRHKQKQCCIDHG